MDVIKRHRIRRRRRLIERYYRADSFNEKARIALAIDRMDADDDEESSNGWVTMNGTHVLIGEGGEIRRGPAALRGKKYPDAKSVKSKKKEKEPEQNGNKATTQSKPDKDTPKSVKSLLSEPQEITAESMKQWLHDLPDGSVVDLKDPTNPDLWSTTMTVGTDSNGHKCFIDTVDNLTYDESDLDNFAPLWGSVGLKLKLQTSNENSSEPSSGSTTLSTPENNTVSETPANAAPNEAQSAPHEATADELEQLLNDLPDGSTVTLNNPGNPNSMWNGTMKISTDSNGEKYFVDEDGLEFKKDDLRTAASLWNDLGVLISVSDDGGSDTGSGSTALSVPDNNTAAETLLSTPHMATADELEQLLNDLPDGSTFAVNNPGDPTDSWNTTMKIGTYPNGEKYFENAEGSKFKKNELELVASVWNDHGMLISASNSGGSDAGSSSTETSLSEPQEITATGLKLWLKELPEGSVIDLKDPTFSGNKWNDTLKVTSGSNGEKYFVTSDYVVYEESDLESMAAFWNAADLKMQVSNEGGSSGDTTNLTTTTPENNVTPETPDAAKALTTPGTFSMKKALKEMPEGSSITAFDPKTGEAVAQYTVHKDEFGDKYFVAMEMVDGTAKKLIEADIASEVEWMNYKGLKVDYNPSAAGTSSPTDNATSATEQPAIPAMTKFPTKTLQNALNSEPDGSKLMVYDKQTGEAVMQYTVKTSPQGVKYLFAKDLKDGHQHIVYDNTVDYEVDMLKDNGYGIGSNTSSSEPSSASNGLTSVSNEALVPGTSYLTTPHTATGKELKKLLQDLPDGSVVNVKKPDSDDPSTNKELEVVTNAAGEKYFKDRISGTTYTGKNFGALASIWNKKGMQTQVDNAYVSQMEPGVADSYMPDSSNSSTPKQKGLRSVSTAVKEASDNVVAALKTKFKNAVSYKYAGAYDDKYREQSGKIWKSLTESAKSALYGYTHDTYDDINELLRASSVSSYNSKATNYLKTAINSITSAINRSEIKEDTVLYRGISTNACQRLFKMDEELTPENCKNLIGRTGTEDAFMSCGSAANKGFTWKDVQLEVMTPAGTKGIYAEPFSYYGAGAKKNWDGESSQSDFSKEFETILQRGTSVQVLDASYSYKDNKYHIQVAVVGQDSNNNSIYNQNTDW